ncbi:hypothetical protein Tco_0118622, partial [Tanacetum coccineum]
YQYVTGQPDPFCPITRLLYWWIQGTPWDQQKRAESSRTTTTNTEEDWDAVASAEELRTLRGELASLRPERSDSHAKSHLITAKHFSR